MAAKPRSSRDSTNGSFQANDLRESSVRVNGVMVGENREHISILQSKRQQLHQQKSYRSFRRAPSMATSGSEPTTNGEDREESDSDDNTSNLSFVMKSRLGSYRRLMCRRRPRGIGVLIILILAFLEAFAFTGALTGVRRLLPLNTCRNCPMDWESFVLSLLYSSVGRIFYPVAGVIADSYLGRYRVINVGFWLLWVGFAISSMSFSIIRLISKESIAGHVCQYIVAAIAVILFGAGSGSVEATIIPFGVDQLAPGVSSDEISSYFYYYYITRNFAVFVLTFALFVVFDEITFVPHSNDVPDSKAFMFNSDADYITQNLISILAVTFALLLLLYFKKKFYLEKQQINALKSVTQVLCYAATVKRQLPQRNRAFRYGGSLTSRIDLAKMENDGNFSSEEVEEVKTFYRMLLLMLSLFGYFVTYGAGFAYLTSTLRSSALNIMPPQHKLHYLAENVIWIINTGSVFTALPIINHLLIPLIPTINIRIKIGIGFVLHVLSFCVAGLVHWRQEQLGHWPFFWWIVFATILLSIGETTVFVSSLEFIYAQSPNNMKGLLIGMFFLIYGIFSAIGSTIYFVSVLRFNSSASWSIFCYILMSIGVFGLVVYGVVAFCYKNRQRPATDESDIQHRLVYANVYGGPKA